MVSPPPTSELACQVDFSVNKKIGELEHFEPLRENLQPVLKLLKSFLAILDCNGSIAKHFNTPLFSSKMEAIISESFSCPCPRIVELSDAEGHHGFHLTWGELAREGLCEAQFKSCDGDIYHCRIRGTLVEVSKADRDVLCSDFLQRLLQARVDPDDVQIERDSRSQVIADLIRLNEDVLEATENIQRILRALREQDPSSGDDIPSADPTASASLTESPKHTAGSGINSVTHSEAMDGVEQSAILLQHERMNNTFSEPGHSGASGSAPPPKAASSWTTSEKRQLRAFLPTRQHLTWAQIAKEYEQTFQMGRSVSSIAGQARQMGFLPRRKNNKQATRSNRRNLVVLKACIPHNRSQSPSTESNTISNPSRAPSASPREEIPEKSLQQPFQTRVRSSGTADFLNDAAVPTTRYSNNGGSMQDRCIGNEPTGSFDWILN